MSVVHNETQLVKTIKAHLAKAEKYQSKAEEHFITAGQYLMTLKGNSPDQATFLQIVKEQIGLGKSRTYELLQIADGTKTVKEVRERSNESSGKSHAKARETSRPLISGQTADAGNEYPADYQSPWDAHGQPAPGDDMPTAEKAPDLNPLITAWNKATRTQRHEFLMTLKVEVLRAQQQIGAPAYEVEQGRADDAPTIPVATDIAARDRVST
jgi:hypothetical protein